MTVLVLCGGKGTRLRSVLGDRPKLLAPVAGRSYADFLFHYLQSQSMSDVVLCTGYLADAVVAYCGDGSKWGLRIRYSHESAPLGTGGALRYAQSLEISNPFWVINGDSLVEIDFGQVYRFHVRQEPKVTVVLTEVSDVARFGAVALASDGSVRAFSEKMDSGKGYINAGAYLMNQSVMDEIPGDRVVSLEREVLPALVGRGLYGYVTDGMFIDIGTDESFRHAHDLLRRWATRASG